MIAGFLGSQHCRDEILAWRCATQIDHALEVAVEGVLRFHADRALLGRAKGVEKRRDGNVRPAFEVAAISRIDAQHFRDDDDRERPCERRHQIELGCANVGEQSFRDLADPRPQLLDRLRRERLVHESAQSTMIGIIEKNHRRLRGFMPRNASHGCDTRHVRIGICLVRI